MLAIRKWMGMVICGSLFCGSVACGEMHKVAEDDFGIDGKQPHLSMGSNFTLPGNVPADASSIVFGSVLTANYMGLNPDAEYRLDLTFFSDGERVQKISVGNEVLEEGFSLPVGSALTKSYALPKTAYADGLLSLNLTAIKGPNAVISKAVVYSSDPKALTMPSKADIYQSMRTAQTKKMKEQVLPEISDALPVFRPMDLENVVMLDGEWQVETAAKKGSFHVPGQLLQQGYDVPKEEVVTFFREFSLPERFSQKNVYLRLDAMHGNAKYTLNGKRIGESERLFTPVEFDITGDVKPGVNIVRIESQLKSDSDTLACASDYAHHSLHGIPRSVRVFALPKVYLEDIAMETDLDENYTNAILKLTLQANLDTKVKFMLKDGSNGIVLTKELGLKKGQNKYELPVKIPAKWTAETPNLYMATFDVDGQYTVTRQVGFREIQIDGSRIHVNGQPIKLSGVNRHEVDALSGRADTAKWAEKDVALFKAANVNYVRCSHYPPTCEFLDACDRAGLYVLDEAPFVWVRGDDKLAPELAQKVVDPTLAMVARDRNHPCIIGWSLANESGSGSQEPDKPIPANFIAQYHAVKKNDPSRFCIFNNEWALDSGLCEVAAMHYQGLDAADREITGRPILMDEYWHVVAYSPIHQIKDPGLRDSWGLDYDFAGVDLNSGGGQWQKIVKHDRFQGAAVWAGIDEVFEFPNGTTNGYGPWGSIADTRRRIKPEFFHVKMHYSPVWIEKPKQEDLPSGSTEVSVKIENRYSFVNLDELKAEWEYLGKNGVAELPNVAPRGEGMLTLNTPPTRPGETLKLLFKDSAGNEIANWGILTGRRPVVRVELPSSGATARQINQKISIQGQDWSITLDSVSGGLSDKVGTAFTPVVLPSPFIIQSEGGFVGNISQYYGDLPDLMTRKIGSVAIGKTDAGILTLTVKEVYGTMDGTLVWKIGKNGVSTFDYDYAITRNFFHVRKNGEEKEVPLEQISESGLRFALPEACDSLAWKKPTRWGAAPDWHIGRPSGKAKAHYDGELSQSDRPWQMQETENGTADFRSTKYNVYDVSLTDRNGSGIHYTGSGGAHARASITENGTELRLVQPEAGRKDRIKGSFTVH
jgi:hypothetical protein